MFIQRARGLFSLLVIVQAILAFTLFWAHFEVHARILGDRKSEFFQEYVLYSLLILAGLAFEYASRRAETFAGPLLESSLLRQAPLALRQTAYAIGALLVFLALTKDSAISRAFLVTYVPLLFLGLLWTNLVVPRAIASRIFRGTRAGNTLLVGPVDRARGLVRWMERKREIGFRPLGILTDDPECDLPEVPRLGGTAEIGAVLEKEPVHQVVVLEIPLTPELAAASNAALQHGARLLVLSDLEERLRHPITHWTDEGYHFLAFHEEPLENPFNRIVKRGLDIGVALVAVTAFLPVLCALVAVLHRLQSPGPLFHRQMRSGLQNRAFRIWKFRTMHVAHGDEAVQAIRGDDRVFPAGRWMRRFGVDEIPQFLNVLLGDMSVVGPRPHLVEHNRQFAQAMAHYHIRSYVKPGITGLAQVRGFRGEAKTVEDIERRLQSDLTYIENWSFPLDIGIIVRTAWQMVFPPPTAY